MTNNQPQTVLDALIASLRRAGDYNREADAPPLAILWPDEQRQWQQIVPQLRDRLPILTLGGFDQETRTGPAIWIRAELATSEDDGMPPIVYLPGIGKDAFRAVEEAPSAIQMLLYLRYRGTLFLQPNGKDWTLTAYLQNAQHGLGIRVDGSEATRFALVNASATLLQRPVADLRQHAGGIDADFLNTLLISDLPRRILDWINDPVMTRGALDANTWQAFEDKLRDGYKLDPERDGPSEAARMLGSAEAGSFWLEVWDRFAESPHSYPNIPDMLRGAKPGETGQRGLFGSAASHYHWPQDNEEAEDSLRQALRQLTGGPEAARQRVLELEAAHAPRRDSVWAKLGQAPLAQALAHLATIARETAAPFPAGSVATMLDAYTSSGWQIDAAALDALHEVITAADLDAVEHALEAIYAPWLWRTAEHFQQAMRDQPIPARPHSLAPLPGTCVLFADGLRYDLAARLTGLLRANGFRADITGAVGPLPGVTPSAKPAQSPVAHRLQAGPKLNVEVAATGSAMTQTVLKKLLTESGWRFLAPDETSTPDGETNAWTELGHIDSYGHNHPHDLPRQARHELDTLRTRITELLAAGWARVMVITDHGWLLTPRPMPKTDLPQHLTVERKGRCARLSPGAKCDVQVIPWCWDPATAIAMAPGISCFEEGKRYEHGGLSLQECIVPTITVTPAPIARGAVAISAIEWHGLRCRVALQGNAAGLRVDLRQRAGDEGSSLAASVPRVGEDGQAGILIEDDAHEGESAIVVVLDREDRVIARRSTIIGGE